MRIISALLAHVPAERLALHMHDTRGTALANIFAGLLLGIASFDSSAGGLGGCPYAPGASGNMSTEDLVSMLDSDEYSHGNIGRKITRGVISNRKNIAKNVAVSEKNNGDISSSELI